MERTSKSTSIPTSLVCPPVTQPHYLRSTPTIPTIIFPTHASMSCRWILRSNITFPSSQWDYGNEARAPSSLVSHFTPPCGKCHAVFLSLLHRLINQGWGWQQQFVFNQWDSWFGEHCNQRGWDYWAREQCDGLGSCQAQCRGDCRSGGKYLHVCVTCCTNLTSQVAVIIGVLLMAALVFFLWRKKRQTNLERWVGAVCGTPNS